LLKDPSKSGVSPKIRKPDKPPENGLQARTKVSLSDEKASEKVKQETTALAGNLAVENLTTDDLHSEPVNLPSTTSEPVGLEDVQVMKATVVNEKGTCKPRGSAYITVLMRIGQTQDIATVNICVDTGADLTLCTLSFLKKAFGEGVTKYIRTMRNPPRLRSATGHQLEILGRVNLIIYMGTYKLDIWVVVQEGDTNIFLLGSDVFYDRLIFDRGKFITFADSQHEPVPIKYALANAKAKSGDIFNVAPKSSALIPVKITDDLQLVGKDVIIGSMPTCGEAENPLGQVPTVNSVATIDSNGCALVLVENMSDDLLTIYPECNLGVVHLLSEEAEGEGEKSIFYVDEVPSAHEAIQWPKDVLTKEFVDRLPSNVHLRTKNIQKTEPQLEPEYSANYVHDKEERKQLLDGTGEGFPTPPTAEPFEEPKDPDPDDWLNNIEHSHLTESQWFKLKEILLKYKDAFSKSKTEIGCCTYFKAELPLKPGTGYLYNKPRPLPFKHREVAAQTISDLLEQGIIRPSKSPHATNIVVVKKKALNGVTQHRVCVDLRQVNENSIPNRFPNFQVEDAMAKIQGSVLRTSFDFANAFHQILLKKDSIPVTAFYFNNVLYEYVRVPFGHVCAMNIFCCVMALLCEKYPPSTYYADDLMVLTRNDPQKTSDQIFDQHLEDVSGMLARIIQAGLKLKAHKCQWCFGADRPMDWLGFTLEDNLLKPQEAKIRSIKDFPTPVSSKQAISFVSLASFYRRFVKNFALIAKPIYAAANAEPFEWDAEADQAFNRLKDVMCSDLILRLPRQGEPFIMYSDASHGALGVVLCQKDPVDGLEHPCAYGSRKFNESELKLSTPCKELLAIVYGLNLWSFYICGNPIHIYSDCRAWTFLKMQTGVSGKISRLALLVSEYDITVSYVPGTKNKAADGLSRAHDTGEACDDQATARHPALEGLQAPKLEEGQSMKLNEYLDQCESYIADTWPRLVAEHEAKLASSETRQVEEADYVEGILSVTPILHIDRVETDRWKSCLTEESYEVNDDTGLQPGSSEDSIFLTEDEGSVYSDPRTTDSSFRSVHFNIRFMAINDSCFSVEAFREAQAEDRFCSRIIEALKNRDPELKDKGYFCKHRILMRQFCTEDGQVYNVICVPKSLTRPLMESTHKYLLSGHHGSQKYLLDMSRKYFWKGMRQDVEAFQRSCFACQLNDKYPVKFQSGQVIRPLYPMHIVHYDLVVGLPRALDGSYAILLFYDGFSRFTFGIPLASEKADYIVKKVMSHFVAAFGLPWSLHSDNGKNVDGNLIRHLAAMLGVIKTTTPPHTPNANPCETACAAISMLIKKALSNSDKRYWSQCLPFVLNAINSTTHTAHGYTPNSLFFGRYKERPLVPLVPFDAESANINEYYQKMRRFQELSFQIARVRNEKRISDKKKDFDKTALQPKYQEGDYVMIKNLNPASGPGKMKLRARYLGPYRVLKVYPSSLAVIPWTENEKLEEYFRQPNIFRFINRGDIRPFHVKMVSIKHCKPYRGKLEQSDDVIDPIMLHRFLKELDVNCNDEIVSIVLDDKDIVTRSSRSSLSTRHSPRDDPPGPPGLPPAGPGPQDDDDDSLPDGGPEPAPGPAPLPPPAPGPAAPPPPAPGPVNPPQDDSSDSSEGALADFEVDLEDKCLIGRHLLKDDQWSQASSHARSLHRLLADLLQAAKSANRDVRETAHYELGKVIDKIKREDQPPDNQFSTSSNSASFASASSRGSIGSEGPPDLEWDDADVVPLPETPLVVRREDVPADQRAMTDRRSVLEAEDPPSEAEDQGPDLQDPDRVKSPTVGARGLRPEVIPKTPFERIHEWVSTSSPDFPVEDVEPLEPRTRATKPAEAKALPRPAPEPATPVVTRAGRISKPTRKFDPYDAELEQRERRHKFRQELESSKALRDSFLNTQRELLDIEVQPLESDRTVVKPISTAERGLRQGAIPKTGATFVDQDEAAAFSKSSKMARSPVTERRLPVHVQSEAFGKAKPRTEIISEARSKRLASTMPYVAPSGKEKAKSMWISSGRSLARTPPPAASAKPPTARHVSEDEDEGEPEAGPSRSRR